MGVYSDYLNRGMSGDQLMAERKLMLQGIASVRRRDLLVYAADVMKAQQAPVALGPDDLLPITDQLENLSGTSIDVILETGGGSGEVAEDIVRILRSKYESVAFIIPGMAKSAGAIMVMSGDEILMDSHSALGPIDAQIQFEGRQFSAEALIKGFEKIKTESASTNSLNRAYIPLLQRISPGDLQHAQNALDFARILVGEWLAKYKFKNWSVHSTHNPGSPVTDEQKKQRSDEIASALCDHSRWLTHGRSIRMEDLRNLGLQITDFHTQPALSDFIRKYHVLLQMTFSATTLYKVIETPHTQIVRFVQPAAQAIPGTPGGGIPLPQLLPGQQIEGVMAEVQCNRCQKKFQLQMDFDTLKPLQSGAYRYPPNDLLKCDQCGNQMNLAGMRQQVEMQARKPIAR